MFYIFPAFSVIFLKIKKQVQVENTVAVKLKFDKQAAFRVYDELICVIRISTSLNHNKILRGYIY